MCAMDDWIQRSRSNSRRKILRCTRWLSATEEEPKVHRAGIRNFRASGSSELSTDRFQSQFTFPTTGLFLLLRLISPLICDLELPNCCTVRRDRRFMRARILANIHTCYSQGRIFDFFVRADQWPIIYRLSMISYLRIRLSCRLSCELCSKLYTA